MASQPANSAILVHRRVRSQRDLPFHRSTFETFQRINPQVMVVPGEEHLTVTETRDVLPSGTAVLNTSLTVGRSQGLPIVRYAQAGPTLEEASEAISGLNFPVRIGQDSFLEKGDNDVADDLHQDLRDV
jgi:hypothetical protein